MKYLFLLLVLSGAVFGQASGNVTMLLYSGAPTGTCNARQLAMNQATGQLYSCNGTAWQVLTGGGGTGNATGLTFDGTTLPLGTPAPTSGQVLTYNGTAVVGSTPSTGGTTLTGCTTPTSGNLDCTNSMAVTNTGTGTMTLSGTGPGILQLAGGTLPAPPSGSMGALVANAAGQLYWSPGNGVAFAPIGTSTPSGGPVAAGAFGSCTSGSLNLPISCSTSALAVPAGSAIIVLTNSNFTIAVADSCGNTYQQLVNGGTGINITVLAAFPVTNPGNCTVSVNVSGTSDSPQDVFMLAQVYSGVGQIGTVSAVGLTNVPPITTPAVSVSAGDWLVGTFVTNNTQTWTAYSPSVIRGQIHSSTTPSLCLADVTTETNASLSVQVSNTNTSGNQYNETAAIQLIPSAVSATVLPILAGPGINIDYKPTGIVVSAEASLRTIASGETLLGGRAVHSGECVSTAAHILHPVESGWVRFSPHEVRNLKVYGFLERGHPEFQICNRSRATVTPPAFTAHWRVVK
jgi:uncharacterized protein YaiE (UPF0345 family)